MSAINVPYTGFSFLPHQEVGVRWMIDREMSGDGICRGGILADDMGLGKTWQTIGLLTNCLVGKTLLVAPPVLISQWQEALDKSGVITALFWDKKWKGAEDAAVYLVTYDKVWRNMKLMTERVWDRVVHDEGHFIRNAKTKRAQSLLQVRGDRKWVLSGTPVQNGLSDFRTLLDWLGYEVPRIGAMAATAAYYIACRRDACTSYARKGDACLRRRGRVQHLQCACGAASGRNVGQLPQCVHP